MKVQNHITIFTGDTQNNAQPEKADRLSHGSAGKKTIYAGSLLTEFPLRDRIQQRRAQAQERAMKIVGDTWNGDKKIDEELNRSRERIRELQDSNKDAQNSIRDLTAESEALMEAYQVDPDSEEQQELELLKKAQAANHPWAGINFTEEEKEKLAEIRGRELTEYQMRQLQINETVWNYRNTIYRTDMEIAKENAVIRGIRLERLKKDPMLKAQQEADKVMEAAKDEAVGMIVDEAKEHLDEEQEKKEEEAEAVKEKKEEQEEILEKRKDREDELEELMEDMPLEDMADLKNTQAEIQQEIQNVVSKMNLVAEDIKGATVDVSV